MPFHILDYNGLLSEQTLTHPSAQERQGKFMLVEQNGATYLVVGNINIYGYHADLLSKFCLDNNISHEWISRPAHLAIRDESVKLHGGGWVSVKTRESRVIFFGKSTAYGPFVYDILKKLLEHLHFTAFTATIQR